MAAPKLKSPPPPARLEDIYDLFESERAKAPAPRAVEPEAKTSDEAPPTVRPGRQKTESGMRPRRPRTVAATVDAVIADLSNDPRCEEE